MFKNAILLIGMAQGIFLVLALSRKKFRSTPSLILMAWVFVFVLTLAGVFLSGMSGSTRYERLFLQKDALPFLYSPFLLIYCEAVTGQSGRFELSWLLHALPFAGALSYHLFGTDALYASRLPYILSEAPWFQAVVNFGILNVPLYIIAVVHHALCIARLRAYAKIVKEYYSTMALSRIAWLRALIVLSSAVWIVAIYTDIRGNIDYFILSALYSVIVYIFSYKIITEPEMFLRSRKMVAALSPGRDGELLQTDARNELIAKFIGYVERSEAYLDPDITMGDLCSAIDAPVHQVSKALNGMAKKSFYRFINEYRVREAKRLLGEKVSAGKSVLDIGLDAGFNSKSTFNDVFKRMAGMTPTEYRAKVAGNATSE